MKPMLMTTGLLLASLLAGCSGDDGSSDVASVSTSTQTNVGNTSLSGSVSGGPGGVSGNGSVQDPRGNASVGASWSYDNRSGTVSGNGAVLNVPFEKEETVTVSNGTSRMVLNVTAQGDALTVLVRGPGCEEDACAEESQDVENGDASFEFPAPAEGTWTVVFQLDGAGPVEADYTLAIALLAPEP